ncbi:MAG: hypothetical protein JWL91_1551 [Sphingomonas bacterium]|nr:FkbM family methyltransferase [Sphingomonas bacterium]MDB5689675.1 hypothetical protein [Sphingomonas bacterium]
MLNLDVGIETLAFDRPCIRTTPGVHGHAVFGPYEERTPGSYTATFTIALADDALESASGDTVCAGLDVVSNAGRTLFARREVHLSELRRQPGRFSLDFALNDSAVLEYRVSVGSAASLLVADRPEITDAQSVASSRRFPDPEIRPAPMVFVDHLDDFRALHARGAAIRFAGLDRVAINFGGRTIEVASHEELVAAANALWPNDGSGGRTGLPSDWEQRSLRASERRERLMSFGPHAFGLLVDTRNGLFAVDPEDNSVSAALLRDGSYADHELALARSVVSAAGDVLVVGTHIGALAVPLAKSCRELVAIEANPHTFAYLKANMLLNGCTNATLHNLAASERDETIKFLMNRDNSGGSKRMPAFLREHYVYDDPEVIEIDAVPLDRLVGARAFDLIFMDIEGSEYFALKGMQELLGRAGALAVEFLPHHLIDVANVGVDDFIAVVVPHFGYMYVPGTPQLIEGEDIAARLRAMFAAGEQHDGLYFLKTPTAEWMRGQGIPTANAA